MFDKILKQYGLDQAKYKVIEFGSGLINSTWKICGTENFILQQINTNVFTNPYAISQNTALLQAYLKETAPDYLFVAPLKTIDGNYMVQNEVNEYFRLFPFVEDSVTLTEISNPENAFEAARQFGRFTYMLRGFNLQKLAYPLPDFHNLKLRSDQFEEAVKNAGADRLEIADNLIKEVYAYSEIVDTYNQLTQGNLLPMRVIHHDTKISNVLFDKNGNGICVIDLDTVMPGYFLSDIGDMMRTYLSPANEEEKDFSKIYINKESFYAIYRGYQAGMNHALTDTEKQYFIYAGKFIIYMQVIRFLADYLNGDTYYHTTYPQQNLIRAQNQMVLLNKYTELESVFKEYINTTDLQATY